MHTKQQAQMRLLNATVLSRTPNHLDTERPGIADSCSVSQVTDTSAEGQYVRVVLKLVAAQLQT